MLDYFKKMKRNISRKQGYQFDFLIQRMLITDSENAKYQTHILEPA